MKALILAAGFGTRLLPHTKKRPKPLFTLNGVPLLQLTISRLIQAGCTKIFVNTHHLHDQIESYIENSEFPIPVIPIHESHILDTGGAVKNIRHLIDDESFFVVNSDIVSDIDLKSVWEFHHSGHWPATLVLHEFPQFNKVVIDEADFIHHFNGVPVDSVQKKSRQPTARHGREGNKNDGETFRCLAFTGIQVLSSKIFDHMPDIDKFSSISVYSELADQGRNVKAYVSEPCYWQDMGTVDAYLDLSIRYAASTALDPNGTDFDDIKNMIITPLAGDGSDRRWYRCHHGASSSIVASHGIHTVPPPISHTSFPREIDSFIKIGRHLTARGVPVPEIKAFDRFSGLVLLEDLGDMHLQQHIKLIGSPSHSKEHQNQIIQCYKDVCDLAIDFSIEGIKQFDDSWTFQTPSYSKSMILENECRYFMEAFVQGYLNNNNQSFDQLFQSFEFIADHALENAFQGLMHRDMQSRNIMVKGARYFFIDFQSARRGPLQYDLASLLIDPYVNLPEKIRETQLDYCANEIHRRVGFDQETFKTGYRYCAVTRNLQMLGAFGHLTVNKNKPFFEQYISPALNSLKLNLKIIDCEALSQLYNFVNKLHLS